MVVKVAEMHLCPACLPATWPTCPNLLEYLPSMETCVIMWQRLTTCKSTLPCGEVSEASGASWASGANGADESSKFGKWGKWQKSISDHLQGKWSHCERQGEPPIDCAALAQLRLPHLMVVTLPEMRLRKHYLLSVCTAHQFPSVTLRPFP